MALDGELVMYVCQSKDEKVTKKVAWRGYAYTKRGGKGDVSYWYCDQRKICGASLIERNGVFTRKEGGESRGKVYGTKGGWDGEGNHETHPPDLERIENEISRRTRRLEKKQKTKARRIIKAGKKAGEEGNGDGNPLSPMDNADDMEWSVGGQHGEIRIDSVWGHDLIMGDGINATCPGKAKGTQVKTENAVLIDTDGGCYDAWALFLSLASSSPGVRNAGGKSLKIVGITTVNGCTSVDNAVKNVSRVLQTANKKIPVYKGMDSPLLGSSGNTPRPPFFGSDGFGDPTDLPELAHEQKIEVDHAVNGIIKLAEKYKGRLTIIALGPLTNLAIAVKMKPEIKNYVKEVFVMGGNSEGVGNMTVASEFNFFVDPEAAQIVLQSFDSCPVYVLPWETCIRSAASTYLFRTDTIGSLRTPEVDLLNKIEATILSKYSDQWIAPDAVTIACCVNRQIVRKTEQYHCSVELQGEHTRGMMVVDKNFVRQKPANVTLITEIDLASYENMLLWAVGGRDGQIQDSAKPTTTIVKQPEQEAQGLFMKVNQNYF